MLALSSQRVGARNEGEAGGAAEFTRVMNGWSNAGSE